MGRRWPLVRTFVVGSNSIVLVRVVVVVVPVIDLMGDDRKLKAGDALVVTRAVVLLVPLLWSMRGSSDELDDREGVDDGASETSRPRLRRAYGNRSKPTGSPVTWVIVIGVSWSKMSVNYARNKPPASQILTLRPVVPQACARAVPLWVPHRANGARDDHDNKEKGDAARDGVEDDPGK